MPEDNKKAQKTAKKSSKKTVKKGAKSAQKTRKNAQKVPIKNKTAKRDRSDSVAVSVAAAQGAMRDIEPPAHITLRKAELKFWDSIINEFALAEWTDHTLEMAALLTRYMYDLDLEQRKMRREGSVLERKQIIAAVKDKSTGQVITPAKEVVTSTYVNPRKTLIDAYTNHIVRLRRSISLHARAIEGEARDVKKRRGVMKGVEQGAMHDDEDDDLLASPVVH